MDLCKDKFDFFIQTLSAAIDGYLPIKVSRMHTTDKPWLTTKIKAFIAKRQKALAQSGKDSPSFHMWRNKVQASIKSCKGLHYLGSHLPFLRISTLSILQHPENQLNRLLLLFSILY